MRGRKPKPTKLKIVEGNPGKRAINQNEPKVMGTPRCPEHLDEEAKKEWKRMSKLLSKAGLLANVDKAQLAMYCQAWGRWVEAEEKLKKHGMIVRAPKSGYPMQSPYLAIANQAMKQLQTSLVEFGMSPSSRSRINLNLADPEKTMRQLLDEE